MKRPILFLDFDGVLNSKSYLRAWLKKNRSVLTRFHTDPTTPPEKLFAFEASKIDRVAVRRVNRIIKATGAHVVVCSSWRHYHPLPRLRQMLRARGFVGKIIGVTPTILDAERGHECAAWLATHRYAVWSFAALDDDTDYEPMMDRLVRTSVKGYRTDGLKDKHVSAAIGLLRTSATEMVRAWRTHADALTANTVPITPPPELLPLDAAHAVVQSLYAAHGYSNAVTVER